MRRSGDFDAEQAIKVIKTPSYSSRAARAGHRDLQDPSLGLQVPRVLVGISDTMDLVLKGQIGSKVLN